MAAAAVSNLPVEIWELIILFVVGEHRTMESLSLVSKQFLSITNRLLFCLTITDRKIPFLPRLFHRFPNLTSLNLILSCKRDDFDAILIRISTFPLSNIKSLYLSNSCSYIPTYLSNSCSYIPRHGLRALSKTMTSLTSLTCSRMTYFYKYDLFFIASCFPLLEELELSYPKISVCADQPHHGQPLSLPKLRKINLSGSFFNRQSINDIFKNCELLQEIIMIDWFSWRERPRTST